MPIILIAPNANTRMSGESVRAFYYFKYLVDNGHDAFLVTHERNTADIIDFFPANRLRFVENTRFQIICAKFSILRPILNLYFHWHASKLIQNFPKEGTILHYLSPISPVQLRFPDRGYKILMGPLNGNLSYPPALRKIMPWSIRIKSAFHYVAQRFFGIIFGDKKRANIVLFSGGYRTSQSLRWAGVEESRLISVMESGIPDAYLRRPRLCHRGRNTQFCCCARLVRWKNIEMAIKALSLTPPDFSLSIIGEGVQKEDLEHLAWELGVSQRVNFLGRIEHSELDSMFRQFRGLLFPSLMEANGITMQEAMLIGLPVVALRWGGPAELASAEEAILIEPTSEKAIVDGLFESMMRLAYDAKFADSISLKASEKARKEFGWSAVGAQWRAHYNKIMHTNK